MTDAALATAGPRSGSRLSAAGRRTVTALLGVLLLAALWELYKAVGRQDGGVLLGARVLPRADDGSMPHIAQVLDTLGSPEVAAAGSPTVGSAVLSASWYTCKAALAGCLLGAAVGLLLAVAMQRVRVVEHALLPWVLLSQTVPLVALAPLVAGLGGHVSVGGRAWTPWLSVVVVSAYLAFCPVAVGALRGLQSPAAAAVELFAGLAASSWQTLLRLRLPAALPFLLPALRLGATSAVIGAIVAEISTGTRGGIGRLIIEYAQQATSEPARVYAAVAGAAVLGLLAAGLVSLLELALRVRGGGLRA